MTALSMTGEERERFLADVRIGVLGVSSDDGAPVLAPIWYRIETDGNVLFHTGRDSAKHAALAAAGRASMCVQREELPYAYVTIEGPITIADASEVDRLDIATRYMGDALARAYVATSSDSASVAIRITPQRWRTTDYSKTPPPTG